MYSAVMNQPRGNRPASRHVPDSGFTISGTRSQLAPVEAEANVKHEPPVFQWRNCWGAVRRVPDSDRCIVVASGEKTAVGTEPATRRVRGTGPSLDNSLHISPITQRCPKLIVEKEPSAIRTVLRSVDQICVV